MEKNTNKPSDESHNRPPRDEVTKNKIDKHLSDIEDTISEDDIKNINTNIGSTATEDQQHDINEADEVMKEDNNNDEPEKEAPSAWEILDND